MKSWVLLTYKSENKMFWMNLDNMVTMEEIHGVDANFLYTKIESVNDTIYCVKETMNEIVNMQIKIN